MAGNARAYQLVSCLLNTSLWYGPRLEIHNVIRIAPPILRPFLRLYGDKVPIYTYTARRRLFLPLGLPLQPAPLLSPQHASAAPTRSPPPLPALCHHLHRRRCRRPLRPAPAIPPPGGRLDDGVGWRLGRRPAGGPGPSGRPEVVSAGVCRAGPPPPAVCMAARQHSAW